MSHQRIIGFCGTSWRPAKARALVETVAADQFAAHLTQRRVDAA